jgi:hypothetical protein
MQCASAILSSVACPAPPYFSALSYKRNDFREIVTEHKMCALIFSTTLSAKIPIVRRIQRDTATNVHTASCEVPVILVRFSWNMNFLSGVSKKKTQIPNFMKIRSVGAAFHAERVIDGTDRHDEANSRFSQFLKLHTLYNKKAVTAMRASQPVRLLYCRHDSPLITFRHRASYL